MISNHGLELQSIEECAAKESEEIRGQLVSIQTKAEQPAYSNQCDCDCAEKLAALTKRIEALEAKPVASNYPSVSSSVSYGSTGSVSYGSTGSIVSLGSTGSSVSRGPLRTAARVVTSPLARVGHWSYPGEIGNHLAKDHGVSTAGMTREQQLQLHDSLHEGTQVVVRSSQPVMPVVSYPTSNCPGGVCPTSTSVSRSTNSGWWLGKNLGFRR